MRACRCTCCACTRQTYVEVGLKFCAKFLISHSSKKKKKKNSGQDERTERASCVAAGQSWMRAYPVIVGTWHNTKLDGAWNVDDAWAGGFHRSCPALRSHTVAFASTPTLMSHWLPKLRKAQESCHDRITRKKGTAASSYSQVSQTPCSRPHF